VEDAYHRISSKWRWMPHDWFGNDLLPLRPMSQASLTTVQATHLLVFSWGCLQLIPNRSHTCFALGMVERMIRFYAERGDENQLREQIKAGNLLWRDKYSDTDSTDEWNPCTLAMMAANITAELAQSSTGRTGKKLFEVAQAVGEVSYHYTENEEACRDQFKEAEVLINEMYEVSGFTPRLISNQ
jgi:hypothetical protein